MIVAKDLRVNVLGEPLFEKINLVIRSGERVAVVGSQEGDVSVLLRALAGEDEVDRGTVTSDGERTVYVSPEILLGGKDSLGKLHRLRPTFVYFDATVRNIPESTLKEAISFTETFRGGILISALDENLIKAAKVTRVLEIHAATKTITSYSGSYAEFLLEQEKDRLRTIEAYEKQQREKNRLESWLVQKREEASRDKKAPEKGAVIRAKVKYLKREILDKEIPKPSYLEDGESNG